VFPDDAGVVHWLVKHGANACHVLLDGRSAVHVAAERVCWRAQLSLCQCMTARHCNLDCDSDATVLSAAFVPRCARPGSVRRRRSRR
jgi:hypothetical protein